MSSLVVAIVPLNKHTGISTVVELKKERKETHLLNLNSKSQVLSSSIVVFCCRGPRECSSQASQAPLGAKVVITVSTVNM